MSCDITSALASPLQNSQALCAVQPPARLALPSVAGPGTGRPVRVLGDECNRLGPSRVNTSVEQPKSVNGPDFDDFYVFEFGKVVAALRFVTGDADTARDAVDEACARAVERLQRGREIEVLAAWIRVVALNVARGRLRRRQSERKARELLAAGAAQATDPLGNAAATAIDVRRALAVLSCRQRAVVVLYYFFDENVETIAAELRMPAGTVKAALHRARAALAQVLAEEPVETMTEGS